MCDAPPWSSSKLRWKLLSSKKSRFSPRRACFLELVFVLLRSPPSSCRAYRKLCFSNFRASPVMCLGSIAWVRFLLKPRDVATRDRVESDTSGKVESTAWRKKVLTCPKLQEVASKTWAKYTLCSGVSLQLLATRPPPFLGLGTGRICSACLRTHATSSGSNSGGSSSPAPSEGDLWGGYPTCIQWRALLIHSEPSSAVSRIPSLTFLAWWRTRCPFFVLTLYSSSTTPRVFLIRASLWRKLPSSRSCKRSTGGPSRWSAARTSSTGACKALACRSILLTVLT